MQLLTARCLTDAQQGPEQQPLSCHLPCSMAFLTLPCTVAQPNSGCCPLPRARKAAPGMLPSFSNNQTLGCYEHCCVSWNQDTSPSVVHCMRVKAIRDSDQQHCSYQASFTDRQGQHLKCRTRQLQSVNYPQWEPSSNACEPTHRA